MPDEPLFKPLLDYLRAVPAIDNTIGSDFRDDGLLVGRVGKTRQGLKTLSADPDSLRIAGYYCA